MKTGRGYTLIEVIVVLAIMTMFMVIATPYFLGWLRQYQLNAATAVFANHLRAARLLAIYTGVQHQVQLKKFGEGNYYQVVADPEVRDQVVPTIGRVVLDRRFGGVFMKSIPSSGRLTFFPRGTSNNGTIVLENTAGDRITLVVNNFGRVKIESL